jgi:hypothetical protein
LSKQTPVGVVSLTNSKRREALFPILQKQLFSLKKMQSRLVHKSLKAERRPPRAIFLDVFGRCVEYGALDEPIHDQARDQSPFIPGS